MCGIIGVTGEADALPVILGALHQLEYRGYDSAGVALVVDGEIWRARAADGTHSVADLAVLTAGRADRARRRHRAHPLGHPRPPDARERPPAPRLHRPPGAHPQRDHREPRRAAGRPAGRRPHHDVGHRHRGHGPPDRAAPGPGPHPHRGDPGGAARGAGRLLHRRRPRRRARHHRGRPPVHAAGARARGRRGVPGLRHPGPVEPHPPPLRPGRRRGGRAHSRAPSR